VRGTGLQPVHPNSPLFNPLLDARPAVLRQSVLHYPVQPRSRFGVTGDEAHYD
jgi:hypothetical protein